MLRRLLKRFRQIKQMTLRPGVRSRVDSRAWVTQDTALTLSAVWRAIWCIADDLAKCRWEVVKKKGDVRERIEHPLNDVLNLKPNPNMSAVDFKATLVARSLSWGNGYAEIDRNDTSVNWLWLLPPDRIMPTFDDDDQLVYDVMTERQGTLSMPPPKMLHVKGPGNGVEGYSIINVAAQSMGISLAYEQFRAKFFAGGANPSGAIKVPFKMEDEDYQKFREGWNAASGPGNWDRPFILEPGMEWVSIGMPLEDAQFLELNKFQIAEIARWFGVPLSKLMELDRATWNNYEQQQLDYVGGTLASWAARIENELTVKLLPRRSDGDRLSIHVNLMALLRGDVKTRYESYATGKQWGWLSTNDIRRLEDLPPVDDGDDYWRPANMTVIGEEPEPTPAPQVPQEGPQEPPDGTNDENGADTPPDAPERSITNGRHLVTLSQAAAIVNRSKAAVSKWADRPDPTVVGLNGQPNEYSWSDMLPWLESHTGYTLPATFPKWDPPSRTLP